MKKLLVLLLSAAMLLSLCACGSSSKPKEPEKPKELEDISDEDWEAAAEALQGMNDEPAAETEPVAKIYELGETILSEDGMVELVIDTFGYADIMDVSKCVPAEEESMDARRPEEGKAYLYFSGTLNYVGDAKEEVSYGCIAELDYKDGYIFKADGSKGRVRLTGGDDGGSSNGCRFEVLTNNTKVEVDGYIVVPETVETDTESPLLLRVELFYSGKGGTVADATFQLR